MGTTRKTITLSEQQDAWVRSRIGSGDFTNDSEYFRDLIRRDQMQMAKFQALQQAVQGGVLAPQNAVVEKSGAVEKEADA